MGRRDIIITGLFTILAVGGGAVVTAMSTTANAYTPYLLSVGWLALFVAAVGLVYMFRTAPKAALNAAQEAISGPPPREFLEPEITLAVLRNKVENRTSVQIDALTKTYAGKWMRVSGRVNDVVNLSAGGMRERFAVHLDEDGGSAYTSVMIVFREPWLDQLAALNIGDWMTCVAQIKHLKNGVTLESGEIEHVGEPPAKETAPTSRALRKKAAAFPKSTAAEK